ncbi:MAG TPA: ABC transporter permease [Candidatus Acidoferrum sp.]|nr:ABC transporter permease [Candidatus Acidoferrum sp.]
MSMFLQDIRYAFRMLRKAPAFAVIAMLTLGLGIGANTAIFSYVDAWVIHPLPYPQPDQLMVLQAHNTKRGWTQNAVTSTADFFDFQKQSTSFEQMAAWDSWNFNLTGDGPPEVVDGAKVSWTFFQTLGVKPLLGRAFIAADDTAGAPHAAIISEGLWQSRYGGDPKIIGRSIRIDDQSYSVVGVVPGKFSFPLLGICNIWAPLALTDAERADRNSAWFSSFARLKPGVAQQQAAAETSAIFSRLEEEYPKSNTNMTMVLSPMSTEIGNNEGVPQVMILFWIVGLILLIACANVANLMLARATQRTKEMAVRAALGATRGRMMRQLVTESLLLFAFGGAAGTLFGMWGMSWIESMIPGRVRGYLVNYGQVSLDWVTLGFTLGVALLCGLIFGLAPAFQTSGLDVNRTLKEASGQASGSGRSARMRRIFVAAEIALAMVVLISTALLAKSYIISVRASTGFDSQNVMTATFALPKTKYATDAVVRNFTDAALARVRALPGVVSAGVASSIPFGGFGQVYEVEAVGKPAPQPGEVLGARWTAASPDYFSAMQMRLLKGRFFTSADGPGNANVTVIGQTFARQFWPNEDPVGRKLTFGPDHIVCTIVGVVNDVKMYQLRGRPERQMYVPLSQFPWHTLGFVARTAGNDASIADAVRDAIWSVDKNQPVSVSDLTMLMVVVNSGNSVVTKLVVFFGLLALFLSAIGIYGVMSHTVAQRTHEIGIRLALGATPASVMRLVIVQALQLTLIGIAVGVVAALATTSMLASLLYQVTARDPLSFVVVPTFFVLVAVGACYVPARRAMRVDPMVALRYE